MDLKPRLSKACLYIYCRDLFMVQVSSYCVHASLIYKANMTVAALHYKPSQKDVCIKMLHMKNLAIQLFYTCNMRTRARTAVP